MHLAASIGASFECPQEVAPRLVVTRVFFHLCAGVENPLRHETLQCAEAQIQHRIVPAHGLGKELRGLRFDSVLQGLLDPDVCRL